MDSWVTSTTAAQSRLGVYRSETSQWKTALINIQLSGRLVFFKTISKQQYETRSEFRAVSGDLSLLEASQLLAP